MGESVIRHPQDIFASYIDEGVKHRSKHGRRRQARRRRGGEAWPVSEGGGGDLA